MAVPEVIDSGAEPEPEETEADHDPLRPAIRLVVEERMAEINKEFRRLYADEGPAAADTYYRQSVSVLYEQAKRFNRTGVWSDKATPVATDGTVRQESTKPKAKSKATDGTVRQPSPPRKRAAAAEPASPAPRRRRTKT